MEIARIQKEQLKRKRKVIITEFDMKPINKS